MLKTIVKRGQRDRAGLFMAAEGIGYVLLIVIAAISVNGHRLPEDGFARTSDAVASTTIESPPSRILVSPLPAAAMTAR